MVKTFAIISLVMLASCGQNDNISHRQTGDSVKTKPVASPEEQIPGTPGVGGTDSTRPGATPVKTPNDSAR